MCSRRCVSFSRKMVKSRGTFNQVLSLMTVAFNELLLGCATGWLAPTLIILQNPEGEFKATSGETSWLACLEYAGEIPGAIFTAFALDIFGRKSMLASATLIFFLIWVTNALTNSMLVLCITRFTIGFAAGLNYGTNSTYLAENSSPKVRAVFGTLSITVYYIGLLIEYAIVPYFSYTTTSIINATIAFLALFSVLWMREPVQYLLMKGKVDQAENNFAWLRGRSIENEEIKREFEQIKQNVQSENLKRSSFKKIITSRANYKSFSIAIPLHALAGCTGYFPVMSYATMSFSASDILTPNQFTVLFGIIQFLVIVPTSFVVDRFNRRHTILFLFSVVAICHSVTAALYYVNGRIFEIPYFPWLIFSSITLFAGVYAALYPVIFIIRGELFPLSVKAAGGCLSVIVLCAASFLTTKIFLLVRKNIGIEMNFIAFSVFSFMTVIFAYFFLPETKNKTLIEIQEMLEKYY